MPAAGDASTRTGSWPSVHTLAHQIQADPCQAGLALHSGSCPGYLKDNLLVESFPLFMIILLLKVSLEYVSAIRKNREDWGRDEQGRGQVWIQIVLVFWMISLFSRLLHPLWALSKHPGLHLLPPPLPFPALLHLLPAVGTAASSLTMCTKTWSGSKVIVDD